MVSLISEASQPKNLSAYFSNDTLEHGNSCLTFTCIKNRGNILRFRLRDTDISGECPGGSLMPLRTFPLAAWPTQSQSVQPPELSELSAFLASLSQQVRREQPQMFLSLAPTTSASYPTAQSIKPATQARRSSSQSSASSSGSLRFLKLGPVHYGEHPGEHKEDYHEVAVE
ncbi:hypothetical protein GGR54DRAFT_642812 [Hypoxylon sp. NC1633]|nr:hypothetical protein GGR54DRAFT_642812 [Hypoxylon sp. NC1633]